MSVHLSSGSNMGVPSVTFDDFWYRLLRYLELVLLCDLSHLGLIPVPREEARMTAAERRKEARKVYAAKKRVEAWLAWKARMDDLNARHYAKRIARMLRRLSLGVKRGEDTWPLSRGAVEAHRGKPE